MLLLGLAKDAFEEGQTDKLPTGRRIMLLRLKLPAYQYAEAPQFKIFGIFKNFSHSIYLHKGSIDSKPRATGSFINWSQ